jgi:hypothetical protein
MTKPAGRINKEWHQANQMPRNATVERIAWHQSHQKACSCRPIPRKLREEIQKRSAR